MKDGITLHPEHGLNPSIEVCMICGEEMGIALLGNNIKGQAPHHICTGEICDNCKKIIDDGGCFIIEVEDGSDQKNPYRTGRYCAIKKEAAKKILGQEHSVVYMALNRTGGEMPTIIAGVLKRIRDDIDKFVDNKTKDYENIQE